MLSYTQLEDESRLSAAISAAFGFACEFIYYYN